MEDSADFRSDTFTMPDEAMRQVIYQAEVGNAGFGEDPSVNHLEKTMADYFGCDDSIFLPSATMANQVAIAVWTRPGDTVVIERFGHSYFFESGAMSAIAGAQARLLDGDKGIMSPAEIEMAISSEGGHGEKISLVVLENSSNYGGGTIYPESSLKAIFDIASARQLPVHVDGARIWNVIAETGAEPGQLLQAGGSMSVCFSKGLGAPMGAALLGTKDFITEARRIQTMLGGSMRQVGFMAAAAQHSFENNRERLVEDHRNARFLAEGLQKLDGISIDLDSVQTNMVYIDVLAGSDRASQVISQMDQQGVRALSLGAKIRLVTSMLVDRQDCEKAVQVFGEVISQQ